MVLGILIDSVSKRLEKFDHTTHDRVLQQKSSRRPSLRIDHLDSPSDRFGGSGDRAAQKRKLSNALHCVALTSWSQTAQRPIASVRLELFVHGRDLCSGDARMRKDGSFADRRCFRSTPVLLPVSLHTPSLCRCFRDAGALQATSCFVRYTFMYAVGTKLQRVFCVAQCSSETTADAFS